MSRSNRNERLASIAKYGGAFVALLILNLVVWQISAQIAENRTYAERNAHHYAEASHDEIERSCITGTPAEIANCVEQIVKASEDSQRAEYDLQAQRDMSEWSFWVLLVSGFGIIFTAIGIWFVRENLIEMQRQRAISEGGLDLARETNKVAKDTGQKQVRAYLTCLGGGYKVDRNGLQLKPVIQNTGQSPANSIEIEGSIQSNRVQIPGLETIGIPDVVTDILKKYMTIDNEVLGHGTCGVIAATHKEVGNVNWLHGDIRAGDLQDILTHKGKFDIRLRIKWEDVYGDTQTVVVVLNSVEDKQDFASDLSVRTGAMTAYNQKIY